MWWHDMLCHVHVLSRCHDVTPTQDWEWGRGHLFLYCVATWWCHGATSFGRLLASERTSTRRLPIRPVVTGKCAASHDIVFVKWKLRPERRVRNTGVIVVEVLFCVGLVQWYSTHCLAILKLGWVTIFCACEVYNTFTLWCAILNCLQPCVKSLRSSCLCRERNL